MRGDHRADSFGDGPRKKAKEKSRSKSARSRIEAFGDEILPLESNGWGAGSQSKYGDSRHLGPSDPRRYDEVPFVTTAMAYMAV